MSEEKLVFTSLDDAMAYIDALGKDAEQKVALYRSHLRELTGHDPSRPITLRAVVDIFQKLSAGNVNADVGVNPDSVVDASVQPSDGFDCPPHGS